MPRVMSPELRIHLKPLIEVLKRMDALERKHNGGERPERWDVDFSGTEDQARTVCYEILESIDVNGLGGCRLCQS